MKTIKTLFAACAAVLMSCCAFAVPTKPIATVSADKTTLTFTTAPTGSTPLGATACYWMNSGDFERDADGYPKWHAYASDITTVVFAADFSTEAEPTDCSYWFADFAKLTTITGLSNLNTALVTDMSSMFERCSALVNLDITTLKTSLVESMNCLFFGCSSLKLLDVRQLDMAKVEDAESMFDGCSSLRRIIGPMKNLQSSTSSADMFANCTSLVGGSGTTYDPDNVDKTYACVDRSDGSTPGYFSYLAVAYYDDSAKTLTFSYKKDPPLVIAGDARYSVIDAEMIDPFSDDVPWYEKCGEVTAVEFDDSFANFKPLQCSSWFYNFGSITEIPTIGKLDTSMADDFEYMFEGCYSLAEIDLTGFDTSRAVNMMEMFKNCSSLTELDMSGFDTSSVTDMSEMFYGCSNLERIYALESFCTDSLAEEGGDSMMFSGCNAIVGGSGTTYDSSFIDKEYARIDSTRQPGYLTAAPVAVLSNSGNQLTFYADGEDHASEGTVYSVVKASNTDPADNPPWWDDAHETVTHVYFDSSFANYKPKHCGSWFYDFRVLTDINGLEYLDTSAATDMQYMFCDCEALKSLDLARFDTRNVTSMCYMFSGCSELEELNLESFDTSSVTDMAEMFDACGKLTTIRASSSFDVSSVTVSTDMFLGCTSLKGDKDTVYDPSHVDKAYAKFDGGTSDKGYFSVPPSAKAVWNKTTHTLTFYYDLDNHSSEGPVYQFDGSDQPWAAAKSDVTRVVFDDTFYNYRPTSCASWFYNFSVLETIEGIGENLDTCFVTSTSRMFEGCAALTEVDLSNFFTPMVTDMSSMFANCSNLASLDPCEFDTAKVTDMSCMFSGCEALTELYISCLDTYSVTQFNNMFEGCKSLEQIDLSGFETDNALYMRYMFKDCAALKSIDLSYFNTAKVTDTDEMFAGCASLKKIYVLGNPDFGSVATSPDMFTGCASLEGGQSTKVTGNPVDITYARLDVAGTPGYFSYPAVAVLSADAKTLTFYADQVDHRASDIQVFSVAQSDANSPNSNPPWYVAHDSVETVVFDPTFSNCRPTHCGSWFYEFDELSEIIGMEYLNTSEATSFAWMFDYCAKLESIDLSHFDTSKVDDMSQMFCDCEAIRSLDLSSFDTANVTDMASMFYQCFDLKRIYVSNAFTTGGATRGWMFYYCSSLVGGNDTAYDSSHVDGEYARIDAPGTPGYFTLAGPRTVTFDACGGTASSATLTPTVDTAIGTLPTAERAGYVFNGWFTAAEGGDAITAETIITKDVTFYAQWTLATYAISYELGGGVNAAANPANYTVESADINLAAPTREGYTFKGWTPSATIAHGSTGDRVFTATWQQNEEPPTPEPEKVVVTFNANGGSVSEATRQIVIGAKVGALPSATRLNHTFDGWFTSATGGAQISAETVVNSAVTYFAHWTEVVVGKKTVSFNAGSGTIGEVSRQVTVGDPVGALPTPTRTGYQFIGWFTAPTGGTQITEDTVVTEDFSAYARWEIVTYNIAYELGGGVNAANPTSYTIDDAVTLSDPTRSGFTFTGWTPNGVIAIGSTGDKMFTANWRQNDVPPAPEPDKVIVTFDPNGGLSGETSRQVAIGAAVGALPIPTRVGYYFFGWFTAATGGEQVSAETIVSAAVTFFAQWQASAPDMPVVTFDPGNGTCSEVSRVTISGDPIGTLPVPMRTGYDFEGWFTQVSGGVQITADTVVTEDFTAYAHWQVINYTITVDVAGGVLATAVPATYTVEDAITLGTPTRDRYQFIGWLPAGGTIARGSTGAKSFTAQWMRIYPSLFAGTEAGAVNAKGATYNGVLGEETSGGTFTLVVKKAKNGIATATMTRVNPSNGKKEKYTGTVDIAAGECSGALEGITLSEKQVSGEWHGMRVQGAVDASKAKDTATLAIMNGFNKKSYSLVLVDEDGDDAVLTVTFSSKGKAKIAGTTGGNKVSGSAQMSVGDNGYAMLPFTYVKKNVALSFVLWFNTSTKKLYDVSGIGTDVTVAAAGEAAAPAAGAYRFVLDRDDILAAVPAAIAETPVEVDVTWTGKKFDAGKAAKVTYKRGVLTVDTAGGAKPNISGLTLKYSKGALSGSFTVYAVANNKLSKNKFTVSGVIIDGVGYATGVNKKLGSIAVELKR